MKNVKHFTQRYIDWVIKLGKVKFSLLGFLILSIFALCTQIILSIIFLDNINWHNLIYSVIFGLISAPSVIYFFTVLVEKLELSRQELAKTIQDKSTLLATISHELRTPLNGILGLSNMLLDTNLTKSQRNYLQTINLSAVSLGHIFNDIIDLEKIDTENIELYLSETDVHRFLMDIQNVANLMTTQKDLVFELKYTDDLPSFLLLDRTRLSQILWNLLHNAVKFTESGKVVLSVKRKENNRYEFSIQDTGIGIDPHELDKIFELYYQSEFSSKKSVGSGIGLSVSRNIARLMGGDLTVKSQLGIGSTFTLEIEAKTAEQQETVSQSAVKNLRILLVEDIQLNILVAIALLEKLGHQVDVAMSGKDAINAFNKATYDLVLLDIQLPDMTGLDVAKHLKAAYENDELDCLPLLIALTANVVHNKAEYQACGIDDVLKKPLSVNQLNACLNRYFEADFVVSSANKPQKPNSVVGERLLPWFDLTVLQELLDFIGIETYKHNVLLFEQAIQSELNFVMSYQLFLQGKISAQQLAEIMHKLKGAASSLAMQSVQQTANLAQQFESPQWIVNIGPWVEQLEMDIDKSLSVLKHWLNGEK
ncbi:ATP-binding protein [Pasteurellaceae bacterium 22721_9_1]